MGKSQILLTPAEVAKNLKLNLLTIYKYIRKGDLGAIKLGRTYRVSEDDLEQFMNKNRVTKNR